MNPEDLLEEWTDGDQVGMRPKRVQAVRDDLMDATGQAIPRRVPEIEAFLDNTQWKGVITRKLREAVDETADDTGDE